MAAPQVATLLPVQIPNYRDVTEDSLRDVKPWSEPRFIAQSPYTELPHQLDLTRLDYENALLAKALSALDATREDYATAPYTESFNWADVKARLKALVSIYGQKYQDTSFYIVAFRSQIKPSTEYSHLGDLDKPAHLEAIESGGFLKYWFGEPDSDLRNLATCIWRSRPDAIAGGRGPAHRTAAMSTRALYAYWKIDQHRLTIRNNAEDWEIVPWTDNA